MPIRGAGANVRFGRPAPDQGGVVITGTATAAGAGAATALAVQAAPATSAGASATAALAVQAAPASLAGAAAVTALATQIAPAAAAGVGAVTDVATQIAIGTAAGAGAETAKAVQSAIATAAGAGADTAAATQIAPATAAGAGAVTDVATQAAIGTAAGAASVTAAGTLPSAGINPVPFSQNNGFLASGTVLTVNLPAYTTGDFILLILARNNTSASAFTYSAAVTTATELPPGGAGTRMLTAVQIIPNGLGQTSFTVTGSTSVWHYWIANYRGASMTLAVADAADTIGNTTSSVIAMPEVDLGFIATGLELLISAGAVNATATWTTDANTQYHSNATDNAALMTDAVNLPAGVLTGLPATVDRGLGGTNRNQNSLALVLQQDPGGVINLLANPSFEAGTTLATGWTDEHTTATAATYSLTATGATDGTLAQKFTYTGVTADAGTAITEIFQSPFAATPGQYLTFSAWLSGSLTSLYGFIGIEGFSGSPGSLVYLSESDTNFLTLSGTPVLYSVGYLCPAGTTYVAAYLQVPSIGPGTALSVTMDQAELRVVTSAVGAAAVTAVVTQIATATAAGAGSVTAVATQIAPGTAAGAGTATAAAAQAATATAAGAGAASALATQIAPAAAAGAAAASAVATQAAIASAAGAGSVTAAGSVTGAGATASAAGAASVTALATQIAPATAAGAGSVSDAAAQAAKATAAGAGSITAAGAITGTASAVGAAAATAKAAQAPTAQAAGAAVLSALATQAAIAAITSAGAATAIGSLQLAFTVGALTASSAPTAALTASSAAAATTANTAAIGALTAGTARTGGPG
jgi:hypothetical protein